MTRAKAYALLKEELLALTMSRPEAQAEVDAAKANLLRIDEQIAHLRKLLESEIKRCEGARPHRSEDNG